MATRGQARRTLALGAVVALGLSLSACSDDDSTVTPDAAATTAAAVATSAPSDDLAAKVPDAIKADGVIMVGTDSTYAPSEFLAADGKTIQGFDIDLFTAVASKLGLKAQFVTAPFDAIIPGVQSGKYEIGVSSFTINDERKKVSNMVSYFNAGTQWATKAGNPSKINIDDACGKRIAVQKGTVQVDDLTARSKK